MNALRQDAWYGLRQLRRHPSFAVVAVLTLGLGIGVSTALFSVIDAALLRPLPYANPDELVSIDVEESRGTDRPSRYAPSVADFRAWRGATSIVAHAGSGRVSGFRQLIVDAGVPERLVVASASEDFLETYGVAPIIGRSFQVDDTRQGAPAVALLGHAFWQSRFGGDPDMVGRTLRVQDKPVAIIGVLPAGFFNKTALWQASQWEDAWLPNRGSGTPVIARLRPGVTPEQAAQALTAVTPAPQATGQSTPVQARIIVTSMYDAETSGYRNTLRTLGWAVALIVIIACVNVAGLLLARGATRQVELAVRASLGAGRGRLVRQLLVESLMLGLAGALVGIGLAYASLDSLVAVLPLSLPLNSPAAINPTVLSLALGVTVVSALLFGLVPAIRLSRRAAVSAIGGAERGGGAPLSRRAGQWLIGVEVALAVILMTGSGLMIRSFSRLLAVDLGFEMSTVLTLEVEPVEQSPAVYRQYYPLLLKALTRLPEVEVAGGIDQLALDGGASYTGLTSDTGENIFGPRRTVLPGYFEVMGVRPLAGRLFNEADLATGEAVIVNNTGAANHFNGAAVGRTVTSGGRNGRVLRIVGVVPDIKHGGPFDRRVQPQVYALPDPQSQDTTFRSIGMVMRLRSDDAVRPERLKELAESIGPRVLVGRVRPGAEVLGRQVATPRNRMVLLGLLGSFGLLLTLVGIASMTAYAVARRTREVGVRVAMGARPIDVVGTILRDAAWPVALGLVAGLAGTYYATRIIATFLFETPPHDVTTLASVAGLLGLAACLAAWLPARRAASIDPIAALRAE